MSDRDNITFGQSFSDSELINVLSNVSLTYEFSDILNYKLINNGENLSGGQRLRLELVRCLLRNKEIILADEITAALDQENRQRVHELLYNLPIILIEVAHHIDSEEIYDQVIDLKKYKSG